MMLPRSHPRSAEAEAYRHLYSTEEWRAVRGTAFVRDLYTCRRCDCILVEGRPNDPQSATANHIVPHRGDRELFFDIDNIESVCKSCHDTLIQREEARGFVIGSDASGRPIDPDHPWNR